MTDKLRALVVVTLVGGAGLLALTRSSRADEVDDAPRSEQQLIAG